MERRKNRAKWAAIITALDASGENVERFCALREDLAELAKLDEAHGGVEREVALGLRGEGDQPRIVVREVREVRGGLGVHALTLGNRRGVRAGPRPRPFPLRSGYMKRKSAAPFECLSSLRMNSRPPSTSARDQDVALSQRQP